MTNILQGATTSFGAAALTLAFSTAALPAITDDGRTGPVIITGAAIDQAWSR